MGPHGATVIRPAGPAVNSATSATGETPRRWKPPARAAGGCGGAARPLLDAPGVGDLVLQELKVAGRAPGDGALPGQSMCLWQEGNRANPDVGGDAAGGRPLMEGDQQPRGGGVA